jgi:hypothetical protein
MKKIPFPTVTDLFKETWNVFIGSLLPIFFLLLISMVLLLMSGVLYIISIISVIGVSIDPLAISSWSSIDWSAVLDSIISSIPNLVLITVLFGLISVVINAYLAAANILVIYHQKKASYGLGQALSASFAYILPVIAVFLITNFLLFGSMMLFFFPVIFVSLFLLFSFFELVIGNKSIMQSISGSVGLVSQFFGEVFLRVAVFVGITFVLFGFLPFVLQEISAGAGLLYQIIIFIPRVLLCYFSIAFYAVLYKQLKERADDTKKVKTVWIWIVAIIGWMLFVLVALAGYQLVKSFIPEDFSLRSFVSNVQTNIERSTNDPEIEIKAFVPSECGVSIPSPDFYEEAATGSARRAWVYEEITFHPDNFYIVDSDLVPREKLLFAAMMFKEEDHRLGVSESQAFPGLDFRCIENNKGYSLDEFIAAVQANKNYTTTVDPDDRVTLGDVEAQFIVTETKDDVPEEDAFRDVGYIAVTGDGTRLTYIRLWGVRDDDQLQSSIEAGSNLILNNLKERAVGATLMLPEAPQQVSRTQSTQTQPSCISYKIREGEFASDGCYSQSDYEDLQYYLQQFNSAVFSFNSAGSSMSITCSGSDFFKNQCEEDKRQREEAEKKINEYRGIIQGIISRG